MRTRRRAVLQDKTPGNTPQRRAKASSPILKEVVLGTAKRRPLAPLAVDDGSPTLPVAIPEDEESLGNRDFRLENLDPSLDILQSPSVRRSVARRGGKLPVQSTPRSVLRRRPLTTPSQLGSPRLRPKAKHVVSPLPPSSAPSPSSVALASYEVGNENKENVAAALRDATPGSDGVDPFGFFAVEKRLKLQRASRPGPEAKSRWKEKAVSIPLRRVPLGELLASPTSPSMSARPSRQPAPTLPSPPLEDSRDIDDLYADPEEFSHSALDLRAESEASDDDKENAPERLPRVSLAALAATEDEQSEDEEDKENARAMLPAFVRAPPSEQPYELEESGTVLVPAIIPPEALLSAAGQSGSSSSRDNPLRTPHKHPRGRSPLPSPEFSDADTDSAISSPVEKHVRARSRSRSMLGRSSPSPAKPRSAYHTRPSIAPRLSPPAEREQPEPGPAIEAKPKRRAAAGKRKRGGTPATDEEAEDPMAYSRQLEELLPRRNAKRAATATRGRGRGRGRGGKGKARARSPSEEDSSSESEEPAPKRARGTGRGRGATRSRGRGRGRSGSATREGATRSSSGRVDKGKQKANEEDVVMGSSEEERIRQRQARIEYFRKLDKEYSIEKEDVYVI